MKFLVVLCLLALSAAEDDSQEQTQSESTPSNKPTLGTQTTPSFPGQFPPSPLNFGNKETVGNVPFGNFVGSFPSVQGSSDLFSGTQGPIPTFSQGVATGALPNFPQGSANGVLPNFPQGLPTGSLPTLPQGLPTGSLPTLPQGLPTGSLPTLTQGLPTGSLPTLTQGLPTGSLPALPQGLPTGSLPSLPQGLPTGPLPGLPQGLPTGHLPGLPTGALQNFPQGIVSGVIPNFSGVPRTLAGTSPAFHVPNTVLSSSGHPVSGIGSHLTGYTPGVYSGLHGSQGVPVSLGSFNSGNTGTGFGQLGHYRVLPQEAFAGFSGQGLQHQTISTTGSVPGFTGGVFTPNQGVLKAPITGTTPGNLNLAGLTTGNVPTESTGTVFRRA